MTSENDPRERTFPPRSLHEEQAAAGDPRRAAYAGVAVSVLAGAVVSAALLTALWFFPGGTIVPPGLAAALAFLVLPARIALPGRGDRLAAIVLLLLATPTAMVASWMVGMFMAISSDIYEECVVNDPPPCDGPNVLGWYAVTAILAFGPVVTIGLALASREGRPLWSRKHHASQAP